MQKHSLLVVFAFCLCVVVGAVLVGEERGGLEKMASAGKGLVLFVFCERVENRKHNVL